MSSVTDPEKTTLIIHGKTMASHPASDEEARGLWPVGAIIEQRYRVVRVCGGQGITGMGVVYILDDGERLVAAKTFQQQFATNLGLIERFMREARAWILTGVHPHIVCAHEIDIIAATPYLFMEYVESDAASRLTLSDHIRAGSLTLPEALRYAIQCCEGMEHATRAVPGLVHRDLKPDNLLITRDHRLKISDFGLVRCHIAEELEIPDSGLDPTDDGLTLAGSVFGTPAYMAPEQYISAGDVTVAADIYAFGCCFYEAISGHALFSTDTTTPKGRFMALRRLHLNETPIPLRERMNECPDELNAVIMGCLEKKPHNRPNSYGDIRARLLRVLEQLCGTRYVPVPARDFSAREVARQMMALRLLDGYQSAVRRRNLRENYDTSPYTFHLALSSFFHCECNASEERRQLEKAARARAPRQGYEAVRRLADLMIEEQHLDEAGQTLDAFLAEEPDGLDHVLEPYLRIRILQGHFDEAAAVLDRFPATLRTGILRAELLRASKQDAALERHLRKLVDGMLDSIRSKLGALATDDRPGWARANDWVVLRDTLAALRPDWNAPRLDGIAHAVWPDLSGCPDFGSDMAWLSQGLGELGSLDTLPPDEGTTYAQWARRLGYPRRLQEHLERDEFWFWLCDSEGHA